MITPGDVLSYRQTWDDYVMGTARAAQACSDAWAAVAAGQTPKTAPDLSIFALAPNQSTLQMQADLAAQTAQNIASAWNAHAGASDSDILLEASAYLQDFQKVVLRCGQVWQPDIRHQCPTLALPQPPSLSVQAQVVGRIEGLGIVTHGVLQLLAIGADGMLQTAGTIGALGVSAARAGIGAVSNAPLILGLGLGLGVVILVLRNK